MIDPTLKYSTYLGGTGNDLSRGSGVDGAGNVYIVGNTTSQNLPAVSAVQPAFGGETANFMNGDAFVAKFSPAGALVYLTYLGGSGDDSAAAVAVDSAGNAYVVGNTTSTNFPLANPFQANFGGMGGRGRVRTGDAFAAKLNPAGNKLLRGGLGEPLLDSGFPLWDPGDVFIAELDPTGSKVIFATYYGGTSDDLATSIALDSSSNIYVGGCTVSPDLPTTPGALQRSFGGSDVQNSIGHFGDGFVAKFNPTGMSPALPTPPFSAGRCLSATEVRGRWRGSVIGFITAMRFSQWSIRRERPCFTAATSEETSMKLAQGSRSTARVGFTSPGPRYPLNFRRHRTHSRRSTEAQGP